MGPQFVRCVDAAGKIRTTLCARDPIPLVHGKSALAIVAACRSMWCTLRQQGHRGGVIQHCVFDRGGYTAICRRMKQFHALLHDQWVGDGIHSSDALWSLELIICTPCALHDGQNASKWSTKTQVNNSDLLRAVFIGCASARNSMDVILTIQAE